MSKKFEYFSKFVLLDKMAMGGMAEVYRAKAPGAEDIGKIIAIKRILPQYTANAEFIEMFKSEAKIAINLTHGNIGQIYEFGEATNQFYLAMEFIDGRNLRQTLSRCSKHQKALTIEQCVFIIGQVANGLDYAHRCTNKNTGASLNIIHRDISPQNIMLSFEGEVKIIDFGIAKAETKIESTRTGTLKGKFGYMSPEQAEGMDLDSRTDIFSLGIVLWELLSGERLFVANNEVNTIRKIRECQIPSLRKINPNIHEELQRITNKALAKDRSLRYQTAAELYRDLSRYLYKVNPEFTQHELSIFLKSLFKEEILADRKRLTEYAKVAVPNVKGKQEKTFVLGDVTNTMTDTINSTSTSTESTAKNSANKLPKALVKENEKVKDLDLSVKLNRVELQRSSLPNRRNNTGTFSMAKTGSGLSWRTQSTNSKILQSRQRLSSLRRYLILSAIIGGAFLAYKQFPEADSIVSQIQQWLSPTEVTQTQTTRQASKAPLPQTPKKPVGAVAAVSVRSIPMGASITVDNKDTGLRTPAEIKIPMNRQVNITLRRKDYLTYVKRFIATRSPEQVIATLQKASFGYLSLDINGANSSQVDVYLDGQKLAEKLPLRRYPVPAGQRMQIWVVNPYNRYQAKQTIRVSKDRIKRIKMRLRPPK